jgi:hypothetical protein
VPTAIGFLKPVVALPEWTLRELSHTELNAILLHELAHLRRWDDWTNLAQKVLRAVFFFHPAVWWIEAKLSLEREMACDDAVLAETANPRAYAQCLVAVAEKTLMRRGLAMAQAAVSRVRQTTQRVAQILDANRPGATRIWKPALGLVAAFALACVGLLARSPALVSFADKGTMTHSGFAAPAMAESNAHPKLTPVALLPSVKSVASVRGRHPLQASQVGLVLAKANAVPHHVQAKTRAAEQATLVPPQKQPGLVPVSFSGMNEIAANNNSTNQQPPRLKTVVLVYQGLEYDDAGFAHWTICVWRVNIPAQPVALATNPPKST